MTVEALLAIREVLVRAMQEPRFNDATQLRFIARVDALIAKLRN